MVFWDKMRNLVVWVEREKGEKEKVREGCLNVNIGLNMVLSDYSF